MVKLRLIWFDLTKGLPIAVGTLAKAIGPLSTIRALLYFVLRSATWNPFAALGKATSPADAFTRHQLEPVLILDRVFREDLALDPDEVMKILESVVGASGAAFIGSNLRPPTAAQWGRWSAGERRSFAERVLGHFLNAEAELVDDPDAEVAFDVSFCHFAGLTARLGRQELTPLFCEADSVYFSAPDAPIRLGRDQTIAAGDDRCRFRFTFVEPAAPKDT